MAVRDVQRANGGGEALSERLSHREIHCRMAGKVIGRGVPVVKSRSVVDVPGDEGPPWKRSIKADIQCVALVVIERCVIVVKGEVGWSACDCSSELRELV